MPPPSRTLHRTQQHPARPASSSSDHSALRVTTGNPGTTSSASSASRRTQTSTRNAATSGTAATSARPPSVAASRRLAARVSALRPPASTAATTSSSSRANRQPRPAFGDPRNRAANSLSEEEDEGEEEEQAERDADPDAGALSDWEAVVGGSDHAAAHGDEDEHEVEDEYDVVGGEDEDDDGDSPVAGNLRHRNARGHDATHRPPAGSRGQTWLQALGATNDGGGGRETRKTEAGRSSARAGGIHPAGSSRYAGQDARQRVRRERRTADENGTEDQEEGPATGPAGDFVNRRADGSYLLNSADPGLMAAMRSQGLSWGGGGEVGRDGTMMMSEEEREILEMRELDSHYTTVSRHFFSTGMALGRSNASSKTLEELEALRLPMMLRLREQVMQRLEDERWRYEPVERIAGGY